MKKVIIVIIILAILGAGGWFVSSKIKNKKAEEARQKSEEEKNQQNQGEVKIPEILTSGQMEGQEGSDVTGAVSVVNLEGHNFVSFGGDFKVGDCKDPFLFLGKNGASDPKAQIGLMTSNSKSQNYEIPSTLDVSKYNEIWVVCQSTSAPLGHAGLVENKSGN